MARGRMIDKRVGNSKKLGKTSDKAARLYFMIYPHLDSEGRIAFDDLDDLKIEIIPYLKGWGIKKIGVALNELADIELIILYPNKQKIAMQFEKFEDFQTIRKDREAPSKIKPPRGTLEYSGVYRISPALILILIPSLSLNKESKPSCLEKVPNEIDIKLTQLLIDLMLQNDPKSHIIKSLTIKRQEDWINQCRLLREKDERNEREIEMIIRWSQQDNFWKANILSMPKLREKFDQLWLKAKKEKFAGIKEWLNEP